MDVNYYEILEIPTDADEREIKTAYHRLARDLHPDKASTPEEAKALEVRFAQVSAAYNTLKDSTKRAEYDKKNRNGQTRSQAASSQGQRPTATASVLTASRGVPTSAAPSTPGGSSRPPLGLTPEKASIAQKAFARGMQYFKENNFHKAIEFFEAAIQNNDAEAIYHVRLATALIQARKSAAKALDAAQRAIDLEPYNLEYKFNLASIFEVIGSKSNARKIYDEILRWDSGNARAIEAIENLKKKKSVAFSLGSSAAENAGKQGFLQQLLNRIKK